MWAEEKARDAASEKKGEKNYKEFQKEQQALKGSLAKSKQKISAAKEKLKVFKYRKVSAEKRLQALNLNLLNHINDLIENLKLSLPYKHDKRMEQAKLLASDIRKDKVAPEEAFNRLWNLYRKEIQMGSDAEVYQSKVHLPSGEEVEVKYMRVGKQVLAYSNAAGNYIGVLKKLENGNWEWQHAENLEFAERSAVRQAVAVAEGKAIPGFTAVPFWLNNFGQEK